ncbi:MAG: ParB/RepB/Spo0J family partition protein [Alphaproteobacteria bacterium]|nr:ParB/RepB/Spo0J family partition protein [Alphaproteobacteria bacterium]
MSEKPRRPALGRGLAALLNDDPAPAAADAGGDAARSPRLVPTGSLHPGRFQPRRRFDETALEALAASIRQQGILQPLVVRPIPDRLQHFEIIAGERRWRAAQLAKLHEVPVVIKPLSDRDALEIALIENIQREDLNAIEEAEGYRRLIEEFGHTQEALATAVGKSRSHVANLMRLLGLAPAIQEMVQDGRLSAGHARALIGAHDAMEIARQVISQGLSVRQVEVITQRVKQQPRAAARPRGEASRDPDTIALENELSSLLGLKVTIDFDGKSGKLIVHYNTLDQLDDVLLRLNQTPRTVN